MLVANRTFQSRLSLDKMFRSRKRWLNLDARWHAKSWQIFEDVSHWYLLFKCRKNQLSCCWSSNKMSERLEKTSKLHKTDIHRVNLETMIARTWTTLVLAGPQCQNRELKLILFHNAEKLPKYQKQELRNFLSIIIVFLLPLLPKGRCH